MSFLDYPPKLKLSKTLSHPVDDIRVIGFEGRNTVLGVDAIVLKMEEIPLIRGQPAVTDFIIPADFAHRSSTEGHQVYIIGEQFVYHARPFLIEDCEEYVGEKYGEPVPGRKVPVNELARWPREGVEVFN